MSDFNTFKSEFEIGNIYWFVNPQIPSPEPHPHVCVGKKDDKCVFLFCGTSQFLKKKRHFELNNIAFETLVRIEANVTNTITKETFINCNEVQVHLYSDLYNNSTFASKGAVSESELFQIRNGIKVSDLMEHEIKEEILKVFPEV